MVTPMKDQYKEALIEIEHEHRNQGKRKRKSILQAERDTVILWGLYRGWSGTTIGHRLGMSTWYALKFIRQFYDYPALIFRLPVLHLRYRNRDRLFTCAFCGREMLKVREKAAREYVASHIFSEQEIREGGGVYLE